MNCKRLMSKILVFFVSVMVMLFGASESFATTVYMPGDSLGEFLYTEDITFVAQYKKIESKECPAGKYFNGTELVDCSRGYYCPGGDLYDGTVEVGRYVCQNGMDCSEIGVIEQKKCETGFYCEAGIPNKCPAGFQYSVEGSDSINDCYTVVEAGSYIAGVSGLVQCPAGSYCPGGMQVYYGDTAGRMLCEDLEYGNLTWNGNGLTGLGNVGPENCSASVVAGKFFDATAEKVVDCPVDTSSKYRTVSYEQAKNGRVLCEPCNEGYSTNGKTGASSCELVSYKVTLNANGGTIVGGSSANSMACSVESEDIVLPIPSKTGYAFKGWYQNSGLTGDSITHIAAGTCLSDYNLYAKWEAKTYVITLNHNGAEGGATSVVATYGELLPGAEMPTMEGHVFKGYYSEPEGGTQYYNMLGNPVKEWDVDSNMILYAQWMSDGNCEPGMYYDTGERKIKLCPAGSYCPGGEVDGVTCPIMDCPSDYNYSVEGAADIGQCYTSGGSCRCIKENPLCDGSSQGVNSCLYESRRFNGVKYYAEPDVCVAAPGSSDDTYCALQKVTCKSDYYYTNIGDFENGTCDLCSSFEDGEYDRSLTTAFFVPDSYNGVNACYKVVNLPCTEPVCPLPGTGTCSYDVGHEKTNGGYKFYGYSKVLPGAATAYMCPNASFTCNTGYDKNMSANIDPTDSVTDTSADELCTPHVYTVNLDANEGTFSGAAEKYVYQKYNTGWFNNSGATDEITALPVPTREYYTFVGYVTNSVAGSTDYAQVTDEKGRFISNEAKYKNALLTSDITLYARWKLNTYTVVYYGNGGTYEDAGVVKRTMEQSHVCTQSQELMLNEFTFDTNNREFLGWARTQTATVPEYTNGQSVVNLTAEEGARVELYAVWKNCTACAPGKGANCGMTAPKGVCTYSTSCSANYENLQNNGAYNPTCSPIKYNIEYYTNGGEISESFNQVAECTVESGAIVLPSANQIAREDYKFVGWYDNNNFSGSVITTLPAGTCTARKSVYAKWEINVEMCRPGKYYNGTSFVDCPKGYYCPGEGKVTIGVTGCRVACPAGYVDGGTGYDDASQCQINVPQGSYLATAESTKMTVCPAGKYTAAAIKVSFGNTSECSSCESGSYCTEGTKYSCAEETDDVFPSSVANSDAVDDCYTMTTKGSYIVGNIVKTCAAPYYCPGNKKVYYGNEGGSESCADLSDDVEWESAISSNGASTPDHCYVSVEDGYYWNGNSVMACAAGTYKTAHNVYYGQTSDCTSCPAGYKSESGASECYLVTEAGKYVAAPGQGQETCKVGDYCPGNVTVKVSGVGGNTSCATLGTGYTSVAGTKMADRCYKPCVVSAVQNAIQVNGNDYYGATVADTCKATLCDVGYTVLNGSCAVCAADHVCDPLKDSGKQYSCSELTGGVYTKSDAGNGSVDNCYLETEAGKYVAVAGAGQVQCSEDGYCPGGELVKYAATGGRVQCVAGYKSDAGAGKIEQCYTACALDKHATQMIGRDYYGDGADTCEATACESGYILAYGTCGSCPEDHVCDPDYDGGRPHKCSELTGDKYTKAPENTVSVDACYVMTKPGYYVQAAGQGEVKCKVGDYCLGGTKVLATGTGGNMACSTFGSGYTSDVGATVETECYQRCAMGDNATQMSGRDYYGSDANDTCGVTTCKAGYTLVSGVCEVCPADNVCSPVKDNGKPYTCSELTNGVYTRSDAGSGSIDDCYLVTDKGSYVAVAGFGQVLCAEDGYCAGGIKLMRTEIGGREVCPAGFDMADAGAESAQQCYTDCLNATNAIEMSGRDYYGKGKDTCKVELCQAGYTLSDGKCVLCPENNVCRPDVEGGAPKTCESLTNGTHVLSKVGSDEVSDCYVMCEPYDVEYGQAVQLSDTEFYPVQCRYKGVSVTGNPCNIVKGVCVETSCNYDYEMIAGKCSPCARDNAVSYKENGGNCVVESCVSGFHPNGQKCELNTVKCLLPNAVSAERVWNSAKQTFGECVALECEDGYHLGDNVCQADEQLCEVEHGVGIREWNHKMSKWGDCIATKCDPGYTNDRSQTNELWKQCGRCNNMYSAGGELAASSYVDGCEIASCMYDGEKYTLENNECILICDTYSDETGSRKWNASRNKCERTCSPGYMSW